MKPLELFFFSTTCWTRLLKIKTNQNKCVRSMFFAYNRDSGMPYLNLFGILTLENIYKFKVAPFTHKITKNTTNIPNIFEGT